MKVSVVLTTYNRAPLLAATIDSVLRQTFPDFELILSDDCSPDETEAVGRYYESRDPRVRYRCNERNLGMPGNLNEGIRAARGEFIANLHDGDVYSHTLLEQWVLSLDRCEEAAFVFNACRGLDPQGRETTIHREDLPPCFPGSVLLESVFFRRWRFGSPVWGTVMVRRAAYESVGLFQERFGFCSDVDMWLRLADRYHVAYVDDPLISLAALPRHHNEAFWQEQRLVERMFLEARVRHFSGRRLRKALELSRHYAFICANRAYFGLLMTRRTLNPRASSTRA